MAKEAIDRGISDERDMMRLMRRYKNLLPMNEDANYVFEMLLEFEFCGKYPKIKNRYSAIFRAFNFQAHQNERYDFDEFRKFISRLKSNYLDIRPNSFLEYAIENKDSWHKRLAVDFISRVAYLENQKSKVDSTYTKVPKAVGVGAWISMGYLKENKEGFEFQPLLIPPDETDTLIYKLFPSEIAVDIANGGFSLGYSAIYHNKNFAFIDGIEFKMNLIYSKHIDNHLRVDVDPFVKFDNGFKAGAGVSLFGNLERGKFWDRDKGVGVNAFIDYNDIFRFTYVKRGW